MAAEEGYESFVIPPDVGGRYSVLRKELLHIQTEKNLNHSKHHRNANVEIVKRSLKRHLIYSV